MIDSTLSINTIGAEQHNGDNEYLLKNEILGRIKCHWKDLSKKM